ncbi:MAG: hypothetical protein ABR551_14300 [Gemmatimonadales bacterium]
MLLECNRILADWLASVTTGVNVKIPLVPLDGADTAPANVTVVDETRNDDVALGRLPDTLPCVAVSVQEIEYQDPVQPHVTDQVTARVTVLIRYGQRVIDGSTGLTDASYTLRAVLMSLRELHTNEQAAARARGSVHLISCDDLRQVPLTQEVEDAWVTGALRATYTMYDLIPRG